jgi:hypothetical protein
MTINSGPLRATIVAVGILSGASAAAQQANSPRLPPHAAAQLEEARTRLALTEEQRALAEPILRDGVERRVAILKKYGLLDADGRRTETRPSMREARKLRGELDDVRDDTVRRLERVLTKAQIEEYKKLQSEMRDAARERLRR